MQQPWLGISGVSSATPCSKAANIKGYATILWQLSWMLPLDIDGCVNLMISDLENNILLGVFHKELRIRREKYLLTSSDKEDGLQETREDEIYALAGALEHIITASQVEISELQHSLDELRSLAWR